MFCEKCGNKLNDNDKFCTKCGKPVSAPAQPQAPVQTQPEPVQHQAPVQTQPEPVHYQAPAQTQPAPVQYQAPAQTQPEPVQYQASVQQPAPKKGLSKGAKLGILFGTIGAVVLALILILVFAVILPMFKPSIDVTKYAVVTFNTSSNDTVIDGDISGEIELDYDAFLADYEGKFDDESYAFYMFEDIFYGMDISYTTDGNGGLDVDYRYIPFYDASQNDTFKVTFEWPNDEYVLEIFKDYEREFGVQFDRSAKTFEFSISDMLEEQDISIIETTELNVLDYIRDNNMLITKPSSYDDGLIVCIKPFEAEIAGYKVVNDGYYSTSVSVYDGDDYITDIYLDFDKSYDEVKDGDVIALGYYDYNSDAEDKGFKLTGEPVEYTVVEPEKLGLDSAKNHANAIEEFFVENAAEFDDDIEDGDQIEVNEIYYIAGKDGSDYQKLIVIYNNKTQDYFAYAELSSNCFFLGDEFIFEGFGFDYGKENTLDDAKDSASFYIDPKSKFYKATKIG